MPDYRISEAKLDFYIAKQRQNTTKKIHIGVIGAGETGTPLLQQLLDSSFVEVVGAADLNQEMPGIKLAHEHGIVTTTDFMEIAWLGDGVDILIDVTGVAKAHMAAT